MKNKQFSKVEFYLRTISGLFIFPIFIEVIMLIAPAGRMVMMQPFWMYLVFLVFVFIMIVWGKMFSYKDYLNYFNKKPEPIRKPTKQEIEENKKKEKKSNIIFWVVLALLITLGVILGIYGYNHSGKYLECIGYGNDMSIDPTFYKTVDAICMTHGYSGNDPEMSHAIKKNGDIVVYCIDKFTVPDVQINITIDEELKANCSGYL